MFFPIPGHAYQCHVQSLLDDWDLDNLGNLHPEDILIFLPNEQDPREYQITAFDQNTITWKTIGSAHATEIPATATICSQ